MGWVINSKILKMHNIPKSSKVDLKPCFQGEVMRHKPTRAPVTNQQSDTKQPEEQQGPDWECNCKARFMLDGGGGRGQRGRGGGRGMYDCIRHT